MEVKPKSADMDVIEEKEEKFLSAIPVDDNFLGDMDLEKDAEVCEYCFRNFKTSSRDQFGSCQNSSIGNSPFTFTPVLKYQKQM